ncbi:MAG: hypothetical protein RDV48_22315 [Candidatus Eremiobacteraeota bacterium]|nr:hypothetical protein [Candidatus Eremiobacteraeota bacterium]
MKFHYHVVPPAGLRRIVSHRDLGTLYGVRSETLYPPCIEEGAGPPLQREESSVLTGRASSSPHLVHFPGDHEYVMLNRDLFFEEDEGGLLAIEPESAQWLIFSPMVGRFVRSMAHPVPFGYVLYNASMPKEETRRLLFSLIERNFLHVEYYPPLFEPPRAMAPPTPSRYIVALQGSDGSRIAPGVIGDLVEQIFHEKYGHPVSLELSSPGLAGGLEYIAEAHKARDRALERRYRDMTILASGSPGGIGNAETAFFADNVIRVRPSVPLTSPGGGGRPREGMPFSRELSLLAAKGVLEGLSVPLRGPADFESLGAFSPLWHKLPHYIDLPYPGALTPDFSPREHGHVMANAAAMMLEALCEERDGESPFALPLLVPLITLLRSLAGAGHFPCFDLEGPRREICSLDHHGKVMEDRFPEGCHSCLFRSFCTAPRQGFAILSGDDREVFCGFSSTLIPLMMRRLHEDRGFLKMVKEHYGYHSFA